MLPKQLNNINIHSSEKEIWYYVQTKLNNTNIHQRIRNPVHSFQRCCFRIFKTNIKSPKWVTAGSINFVRWSLSSKALKIPFCCPGKNLDFQFVMISIGLHGFSKFDSNQNNVESNEQRLQQFGQIGRLLG